MRWIQQKDPDDLVITLACFAGFSEILVSASRLNLGDQIAIPVIFAAAVVLDPIMGIAGLIIMSILLWWTGSWLGDVLFESRVVIFGSKGHLLIVGFNVLRLMIVIWSLVIFLTCLSEVQKFSFGKALISIILSAGILLLVVLFIAAVIGVTLT